MPLEFPSLGFDFKEKKKKQILPFIQLEGYESGTVIFLTCVFTTSRKPVCWRKDLYDVEGKWGGGM